MSWDYPRPIREATDEEALELIDEIRRAMLVALAKEAK